ncbi:MULTISPECIES: DUF3551 domain-containing protein [unclassified Bradyrhizobium]|uniref:DUF3551 domain-containing protein n=1 Tax=unclassified Bradyrhizobium TaxID=2631580 RepID=UPI00247B1491|nr:MULTISPECIES: DUF3551 domain-containing protein [unclassified Bradyrhizobium]WGR74844.1 DUF3551 domain-containing protein [Bradyrhizobium sp. ISRA426]WGR79680.1 DUF3551 domain-containing protein [Bradyrhizobium sp. ISRA430]WGR90016.1 DUF3551 domain-containing protein [Bradyrhizobium sp. ISRA432]
MRGLVALPIVATFALALFASAPARADGVNHPPCMTGDEWPGLSNCRFGSYAQCQASASGRALTCIANPYFVGQSDDPYAYQNRPRVLTPGYPPNDSWPR